MAGSDVIIICEAGKGQTESANGRLITVGLELAEHWGGSLVCLARRRRNGRQGCRHRPLRA